MNPLARATNLLVTPNKEWPVIAAEPTDLRRLFTRYAMPLAAIGPVIGMIGLTWFSSWGGWRPIGLGYAISRAGLQFASSLAVAVLLGLAIDALARNFDAEPNRAQALKLSIYAATAQWVGGLFGFYPLIDGLIAVAAWCYSAYLLYLGLPVLMKVPLPNRTRYLAVVIIIAMLLWLIAAYLMNWLMIAAIAGPGASPRVLR